MGSHYVVLAGLELMEIRLASHTCLSLHPGIKVCSDISSLRYFSCIAVLGTEPRALHVLQKCLATELHSSLGFLLVGFLSFVKSHVAQDGFKLSIQPSMALNPTERSCFHFPRAGYRGRGLVLT